MVVYHLDGLKVAHTIRARPAGRFVVVQKGPRVSLEELMEE
jgi:hypothetical protein